MRVVVVAVVAVLAVDATRVNKRKDVRNQCGVKGASAPSNQIINGRDATECEWRWQASLQRDDPFCGGTLIAPEWVLTAAHCVTHPDFDVTFGDYNTSATSDKQQKRKALHVWRYPGYSKPPNGNDFALVQLESPVEINDCVGTACLPEAGADVSDGSKCWITGWGTLSFGGRDSDILQEASVDIISNDDCVSKFGYTQNDIHQNSICAQGVSEDGKVLDACQGDSGGPLVCENAGTWTVYGATSWGMGCADKNYPGIWARVHEVTDWIDQVMSGDIPPLECPGYCFLCWLSQCKGCC